MSTSTHSGSSAESGTVKKTVTVIAYAAHGAYTGARTMAADLDPSIDFYERDYRRSRTVRLVALDDEGEEIQGETIYCSDLKDALVNATIDGDLRVVEEVEVSRPYAHEPHTVVKDIRSRLARALPDELAGGVERADWWSYKWQDDDNVSKVFIRSGRIDHRRVLAHHTRRNGRRKYDTTRKHLSMEFTIELGPESGDIVAEWNETVVARFVEMLVDEPWVERVRVSDCVETIEREGDCFDL